MYDLLAPRCVLVLLASALTIGMVAAYVLAEEPAQPDLEVLVEMWACQDPDEVPNSRCVERDELCGGHEAPTPNRQVGCSTKFGTACIHDPPHFVGSPEAGILTEVEAPGTCSTYDGGEGGCTECRFLVCALGTAHPTLEDCWDNEFPCPQVGWTGDACEP